MITTKNHHIHLIDSKTSKDDEHIHYIIHFTGPPIHCSKGHYHSYRGMVSFNDGHIHCYSGYTSIE